MTSLTCQDFAPAAPVSEPYKTAQFGVFLSAAIFMIITSIWALQTRNYRRRMRLRSVLPVLFGSLGGACIIIIRSSFDYVGREYFSCTFNLLLYYCFVPTIVIPDTISILLFLSKQYKRQALNARTLHTLAITQNAEKSSQVMTRSSKVSNWWRGLWNYSLSFFEFTLYQGRFDERQWYHSNAKVSLWREFQYEFIFICTFSIPFIVAFLVRTFTTFEFNPENQCTGCIIGWVDFGISLCLILLLSIPGAISVYRAIRNKLPDPLGYINDVKASAMLTSPLMLAGGILLSLDPNEIMKNQLFDWHDFDLFTIFFLHLIRTVIQIARTRRLHKEGEHHIKLLDILIDPNGKAALLFEKYLMAELANENLLFWREAIKFKLQFDRKSFEHSQESAKILWRTFIAPQATLPINISGGIKQDMHIRFKGVVGRGVFDVALVEVYLMMQNGAFQRFIQTPQFKEYAQNRADFSMQHSTTLQVIPGGPEDPGVVSPFSTNGNINEYIRSL